MKKYTFLLLFEIITLSVIGGNVLASNTFKSKKSIASTSSTGEVKALVILIEFADRDRYFSRDEVDNFFNQVGYNKYNDNGSVHDYWSAVSQGRLNLNTIVTGYFRAPKTFDYYDTQDGGHTHELLDAALDWLDNTGFDFSQLTVDNNKRIKGLSFQFVGNSGAKGLWGHSSAHIRSFDGVQTYSYQISELGTSEMHLGGICHEQGHMLFRWPDTYDIDGSNGGSSGCGKFDLMAAGNSDNTGAPSRNPMPPNPYFRYLSGWNDMIPLTQFPNNATLNVIANSWNTYVYRNPDRAGEMFILEARQKPYRNVDMPGEGVLIWHIDSLVSNNANQQHTEQEHYKVSVVQADNKYDLENGRNLGDVNDYFKSGTYATVNLNYTKWWNGAYSGLILREIGAVGSSMSMKYGSYNASDVAIKSEKTTGGTISPFGLKSYAQNATQRYTATPLDGFYLYNCTVDNNSLGAISAYEFTNITAPHNIKFSFAHKATKLKDVSSIVNYKYYEGSWKSTPDFSSLTPLSSGTLNLLTIAIPNGATDNYGVRFTGYINAPVDGEYTFYLTADDGCIFKIDDTFIVSNQCQPETSGSIILQQGYHPVTIDFFEAQVTQSLSLNWSGPSFSKKRITSLYNGTIDESTAIEETYKSDVRVWLDNQNLYISNSSECINFNVDIYDITGKLLSTHDIKSESGVATISNLKYANGFYLIKIRDDKNNLIKTQKIILRR